MADDVQGLYAYAIKLETEVCPVLVYEPQSEDMRDRIPVSNDTLALEVYVTKNLERLLDGMEIRCGVPCAWRNSLDHSIYVNVYPLVKAGILKEKSLKRI